MKFMKLKKVLAIAICLSLILGTFAGCGGGEEPATEESGAKTLQLVHSDPVNETSPYHTYCTLFADYLSDISAGAWEVEIIGGGQLGTESEEIQSISQGLIDASVISNITLANSSPDQSSLILPFMFNNLEEVNAVIEDAEVMELMNASLYEDSGIVGLEYITLGLRKLFMADDYGDAVTMADLENKKIRVPETPLPVDTFTAMDMTATTINGNEVITAMQQGTVDGVDFPILPGMAAGIGEVSKQLINTNHYYVGALVVFSDKFWSGLSEEEQGWFKEAAKSASKDQRTIVDEKEAENIAKLEEAEVRVTYPDVAEYVEATRPVYEEYAANMTPELIDRIETVLEEYRAK